MISPADDFSQCRTAWSSYAGWQALCLDNGVVSLVAVPEIGGRVMAFYLGQHQFLWNNQALLGQIFSPEENYGDGTLASWKNYGGAKTWPAPQGWDNDAQWHGPPDPVLDTGIFTAEVSEDSRVHMVSPPDPRTGVQIVRSLSLLPNSSHARIHLEMRNTSADERCWSLWEIVQLDATRSLPDGTQTHNEQAWLYVPRNPTSRFPDGYSIMFGASDNSQWHAEGDLVTVQYQFQVGKIGVDSTAGWVAFADQAAQMVFCQCFTYFPGEEYPDAGASVECWTTGRGAAVGGMDFSLPGLFHLEAEVLGPLRRLAPGDVQTFDIDWYAARCPGPVVDVTAAGCCHRPLTVSRSGGQAHLRGTFGVFHCGHLQLTWLDAEGCVLNSCRLTAVTPHEAVVLDQVLEYPTNASAVELHVFRPADELCALLAKLDLD